VFKIKEVLVSSRINIPLSVLQDRSLSVLESVSEYLRDRRNLSFQEIADLTNRDVRTIWTCYSRAKKKRLAISEQEKLVVA